ncbi:patatin [Sphingobium quisquiliarum P25]|uniref:Patatin n=1 Tax=Sphingobium quisquiliarum P25 TaxID=1329909 RepID=T0I4G4_9SPHN|nr:patatin-like protein [Sphingobium quisquiliarum]EQB06545.1 patatin [Sphingobium quisquiliarum P25]
MKERELRLALVCYGGISLAVYMHGITKEIWRLARASRAFHDGAPTGGSSEAIYRKLLEELETAGGVRLRVMPDIIAGASAGGINGIFLAQAIETGQSLEPLTEMWLENADVEKLLDPDARPARRITKFWAAPLVWMAARHPGDTVERTVAPVAREEVRQKLSHFIRSRWFEPPFGGAIFTAMILDAFDAMEAADRGPPLLPEGHPLDLFVTVTDFEGHPQSLNLNSPPQVVETEHRLSIGFTARGRDAGGGGRAFADPAELVFAARATASFPGAFPPFTVRELDKVLEERKRPWPTRDAFLAHALPRHWARGMADDAILIDGSVLANAPFAQAIGALRNRPSRREVDRRFVYIDPKPGRRSVRLNRQGAAEEDAGGESTALPGFFRTIFGALSDIPREQPIRDNLDAIDRHSSRIRRMVRILNALRPGIEAEVESTIGGLLFLDRPTPARLSSWRAKAQQRAANSAGFAFPAYGHLKLSGIVEDLAALLFDLSGEESPLMRESYRQALWSHVRAIGADRLTEDVGPNSPPVTFFRTHDLSFRIRRLRFLARRLAETLEVESQAGDEVIQKMHDAIYQAIAHYTECEGHDFYDGAIRQAAGEVPNDPATALDAIARARGLNERDQTADLMLAEALAALPKAERRVMLLSYLGFPFYDIATLPLLQGHAADEYDPVKVDRISPEDCSAIRAGGAEATLKGIEFNNFGAFFSRAYRENDYLWGRLHGVERLLDIVNSAVPAASRLSEDAVRAYRRAAFMAILDEEEQRLPHVADLIATLREEIVGRTGGAVSDDDDTGAGRRLP